MQQLIYSVQLLKESNQITDSLNYSHGRYDK